MYQEEYKRWMAADLEDPDLKPELMKSKAVTMRSRSVSRYR